jgi:hypothetical protein
MSTRDAVLPARRSTQARTAGARRTKRSDFLRAYSPISFSQAFRVILLVAIGLGFIKMTHVAQARPDAFSGLANHGFVGALRNVR